MRKIIYILCFLFPFLAEGQDYNSPKYTKVITDTVYFRKGGVTDKVWKVLVSGDTLFYNSDTLVVGSVSPTANTVNVAHFVYDSTDIKNDSSILFLSQTDTATTYYKILAVDCKITLYDAPNGLYRPGQTFDIMYVNPNAPVVYDTIGHIDSTSIQTTSDLFVSWTPINPYPISTQINACGVGGQFSGFDDPSSGRARFDFYITYMEIPIYMTETPTKPMCPIK